MSIAHSSRLKKDKIDNIISETILIDFSSPKFESLYIYNLVNFYVFESILTNSKIYKDGILPGMVKINDKIQGCKAYLVRNMLEQQKITEEDVKIFKDSGNIRLTSSYFDNRRLAYESKEFIPKKGEVLAYYVNGKIYSPKIYKDVFENLVKNIYKVQNNFILKSLIQKKSKDINIQVLEDTLDPELKELGFKHAFESFINQKN